LPGPSLQIAASERLFPEGVIGIAMYSIVSRLRGKLRRVFPEVARFVGDEGRILFFGSVDRAPSIAEFFCGDRAKSTGMGRIRRARIPARSLKNASEGDVSIFCPRRNEPGFPELDDRAVEVPLRIALRKTLPDTTDALMAGLKTSTTSEDLRRIRKAGFTYRVTTDPEDLREFYSRHYVPLVRQQFPEDGTIMSLERMLEILGSHGELVCADLDGEWVAGIFNWVSEDNYAMGALGIRGADETVRQKRVVSALLVRGLQRAVELGLATTTLGFSLPFLGKGPIWFKAKWGCTLEFEPRSQMMQMLLDLRHAPVRTALARSPIIHCENGELSVAAWLPPGDDPLKALLREAGRFPGISRWYVLGDPETLRAAGQALEASDRIVPVEVEVRAAEPLWLGRLTADAAREANGRARQAGAPLSGSPTP
jgi:hypothetical protein